MTKHKLDQDVEDILQHFGIKGMKWGVRRTDAQIAADNAAGGGGASDLLEDLGDEVMGNESVGEELGDVLDVLLGGKGDLQKETRQLVDAVKDKVEDVSIEIRQRGERILNRIFQPTNPTKTVKVLGKPVTIRTTSKPPNGVATPKNNAQKAGVAVSALAKVSARRIKRNSENRGK